MRWRPATGNTIIDDRWTEDDDKEGSGQEQTTTNHCALKAGKQRPAERAARDKKGKDLTRRGRAKRRRITTTRRKRIAPLPPPLLPPLPPPLPSLLLLPLPPSQVSTPASPLLPLIKQWQQWWQHGVVACGGEW